MTLPSPLCLLRNLWWSLRTGARVRGHVFINSEVHVGCTVVVSRCEDCGLQSISWHHSAPDGRRELMDGSCRECGGTKGKDG